MAHNYYIFNKGSVNGQVLMNSRVFDEIIKQTLLKMDNVALDTSKGIQIPGTKSLNLCSINDNKVEVCVHVRLKYGVNVSKETLLIQENIYHAIKEMTNVDVERINVQVDGIMFD